MVVTHKVMKYWVAVLLAAADVLDATLDVFEVEAIVDDAVVPTDDVAVVVAATDVVELPLVAAVAGMHWSERVGSPVVSLDTRYFIAASILLTIPGIVGRAGGTRSADCRARVSRTAALSIKRDVVRGHGREQQASEGQVFECHGLIMYYGMSWFTGQTQLPPLPKVSWAWLFDIRNLIIVLMNTVTTLL